MVEVSDQAKVKVCLMRHGQTSFLQEYVARRDARRAAGIDDEQLTPEEIKQRNLEHDQHSLQPQFIDDKLSAHGRE